jgi:Xaa-Pro aminopeptidase
MYEIVLNAQEAAIAACKPGILFKDVHKLASTKLVEGMKQMGVVKGDVAEAIEHDVHTLFFQCGLGHMIGLDVHDMENLGEQYVGYTEDLQKGNDIRLEIPPPGPRARTRLRRHCRTRPLPHSYPHRPLESGEQTGAIHRL